MKKETAENSAKKQFFDTSIEIAEDKINEAEPAGTDFCRNIRLYFREYCLSSSLHGIRYLGEKGRSKIERVWWFLFFIASIYMCSQLIKKTWKKWDTMPVIIGFSEKPTLVWQVPFPAVTICPETKVRQRIYNFTEAYYIYNQGKYNMTELEEKSFLDLSIICNEAAFFYMPGEDSINQSTIDFIIKVAPEFEESILSCKSEQYFPCDSFFSKSLTEEGLCYTFNMLDRKEIFNKGVQNSFYPSINKSSDWSLDKGYKKGLNRDEEENVYPKRSFGSGITAGLTMVLGAFKQDFDYMCRGPFQGVKIILHSPEEVPRFDQHYTIRIPWNQDVEIAIQPDIMTASKELKAYEPSRRNCFFPEEKKLRYFKTYTQPNCEFECLTNYTLNKCGCVAFHMPHIKSTAICGPGKRECALRAKKMFEQNTPLNYGSLLKKVLPRFIWTNKWVKNFAIPFVIPVSDEFILKEFSDEDLEQWDSDQEDANLISQKCTCLPACTSLAYNADAISLTDFNYVKLFEAYRADLHEFPGIQISHVQIYFKDTQFMTWRRSELYDQTDFLASCGGLLGLCMGFSFLSLIEILYFITLRLCCNIKMHGIHLWNAVKIKSK